MDDNEKIKKQAYEDLLDDFKMSYIVIKIICIMCCFTFGVGIVFCGIDIVNGNLHSLFCMIIPTLVSIILIILLFKQFKFEKNRLMNFKKQYQEAINNGYKDCKIETETITLATINDYELTYDKDDINNVLKNI